MAHRRVKDVSYDEDDYDDYEEEEAPAEPSMTTEDQARLREGFEQVREALGAGSPATTKEIEESLWYYYFDVEKTVAYLLST
jgi:elongation factor 1 alpha-like protein